MKLLTVLLVFVSLSAADSIQAQEKYTIKLKELGQGDSSLFESKDTMTMKNSTKFDKDKEAKTEAYKSFKHYLFTQTILERPGGAGQPTKVKRVYDKAISEGTGLLAVKGPATKPYHGKTLLIEKKGDKYEFRIEGGGILEKEVEELRSEFEVEEQQKQLKALVPTAPVGVEETWKVDPLAFMGAMAKDQTFQVSQSKGTAKLVKAYKKDGRLWGTIDTVIEVEGKLVVLKDGKPEAGLGTTLKCQFKFRFDGCIDGTAAEGRVGSSGQFDATTTMAVPDIGTVTGVSLTTTGGEYSWKELPKK